MRYPVIRPGPITVSMGGRNDASYKAERVVLAIREARPFGTYIWQRDNMVYIVRHVRVERGMVACDVEVLRNGVTVPIHNPVYIYDPPVLVSDGEPFTMNDDGAVITVTDLREDPVAAFRLAIEGAVHANLRYLHGRE